MTVRISPCIRLCTIDPLHGLCVGCGRTLAEIGRWMGLGETERRAIMAALPARLASVRGKVADMAERRP
jgi:uncharacterized protein